MWAFVLTIALVTEANAGWEHVGGFRPGTARDEVEKAVEKSINGGWVLNWAAGDESGGVIGYTDCLGGEWCFGVKFKEKRGDVSRVVGCRLRYFPFSSQPPWLERWIVAISPPKE